MAGYNEPRRTVLYHELSDRLRAIPGVRGVTYSYNGLFIGTDSADNIEVEGFTPQNEDYRGALWDQIGARLDRYRVNRVPSDGRDRASRTPC